MSRTAEKLIVEKAMETWQAKALVATQGQKTQLGAIILAITKAEPSRGPKFGPGAVISADGFIFANFIDRRGQYHQGQLVCSVRDYIKNLHGLADALKFSEADRADMFRRAREWIYVDHRVSKEWGAIKAATLN